MDEPKSYGNLAAPGYSVKNNGIGCKALHEYLELVQQMTVNYKKITVKEAGRNHEIIGPNQLWQFDIKFEYIQGEDRTFYFLAFVDVFT